MNLESLHYFKGQIEQCLSRAEQDLTDAKARGYDDPLHMVQSKLGLALTYLQECIKRVEAAEPQEPVTNPSTN